MKNLWLGIVWISCCFSFSPVKGQYFYNSWYYNYDLIWEAGISNGLMNCLTDIGGKKGNGGKFIKDFDWRSFKPSFSFYVSATYKEVITLRLEAQTGLIRAADSMLQQTDPNPSGRYGRNLSFQSRIKEIQFAAEIHPLFFGWNDQSKAPYWSPYFISGISYFSFNPQARLHNRWYDLQPLRLEGQGFAAYNGRRPYKLNQYAIPIGAGLRYETGPLFNLRLEFVHRILFTDYLDDVSTTYIDPVHFSEYLDPPSAALARQLYSRMGELAPGLVPAPGAQRGNAKNKDAYFSIQLKLGYVFRSKVK